MFWRWPTTCHQSQGYLRTFESFGWDKRLDGNIIMPFSQSNEPIPKASIIDHHRIVWWLAKIKIAPWTHCIPIHRHFRSKWTFMIRIKWFVVWTFHAIGWTSINTWWSLELMVKLKKKKTMINLINFSLSVWILQASLNSVRVCNLLLDCLIIFFFSTWWTLKGVIQTKDYLCVILSWTPVALSLRLQYFNNSFNNQSLFGLSDHIRC